LNMLNKLFSFFTQEMIAGLDIGDDYLTVSCASLDKEGKIKLENIGCVQNQRFDTVRESASLIKKLWRNYRVKTRTVCFSFHTSSLVARYFKYPSLSDKELRSAIRLEAEEAFQRHQDELLVDWYIYPREPSSENVFIEGVLVALPKDVVDRQMSILGKAGLYPVALDTACMSMSRLFLKSQAAPVDKTTCVVNLNNRGADIAILSKGPCIYPRNIYFKESSGQERINYLLEGMQDVFRYYQFKLNKTPVEKIVFTGRASFDKDFQEAILGALTIPSEFWDPLKGIRIDRKISPETAEACGPIMAPSLGLLIRKGL